MSPWLLLLSACIGSREAGPDRTHTFAVGTYVGGGSLFGADPCTYEGAEAFGEAGPADGPRFAVAPGPIRVVCPKVSFEGAAVAPDAVAITGPDKVRVGADSDVFRAVLTGGGVELQGQPALEWTLGPDCEGHAAFAPVLGAQDTGGPDRTRKLVASAPGRCTVKVAVTTGSDALHPDFEGRTFAAEQQVTLK
ncbi:MAG: hypothetical protein R3F59_27835 [Myxococcota bacterium]